MHAVMTLLNVFLQLIAEMIRITDDKQFEENAVTRWRAFTTKVLKQAELEAATNKRINKMLCEIKEISTYTSFE